MNKIKTEFGLFDAKAHLSQLVARASSGEVIVITKNGQPMAKLIPMAAESHGMLRYDEAITALRGIRARTRPLRNQSIDELYRHGRRP